jgi:hypothetical protein
MKKWSLLMKRAEKKSLRDRSMFHFGGKGVVNACFI